MNEIVCFAEKNTPWKLDGKGLSRNGWEMVRAKHGRSRIVISRPFCSGAAGSILFLAVAQSLILVFCSPLANRSGVAVSRLSRSVLAGFTRFWRAPFSCGIFF